MKKSSKTIFLTFIMLLGFSITIYAQTYYNLYLCDAASATLRTPEESSLVNGDKVHWYKDGTEVSGSPFTFSGGNSTNYTIPTNLAAGAHLYTSAIESAAGCLGEQSDAYTVYKLPTKTLALEAPTNASYCAANSSAVTNSSITATTTPAATLPAGIEYAYTWSVTKGGVAVSNIATVGSSNNSATNKNVFSMSATDADTYVFNANVVYKLEASNTGVLRSGDNKGCEVSTTSSQTVIVTPKPAQPTITLVN